MKKILLAAFIFILTKNSNAQVQFDALKITPQFPKVNQTVNFKFNAMLSPLIDEKQVDVVIYLFSKGEYKVIEPTIIQNGKTYSGNFKTEDSTECIGFSFISGKQKDNNGGKGFIIPVYGNNNNPVRGFYTIASLLQNYFGEYLFDITSNPEKELAYLQEGIKKFPELNINVSFFYNYISALSRKKEKDALAIINEMQQFENKGNLTERDYEVLIDCYGMIKRKDKVDSLTIARKATFPNGYWKQNELQMSIIKEEDVTKKLALYQDYIARYPPTADFKTLIDDFKSQLASGYAKIKDYKAYTEWNSQLDKASRASNDNDISWAMAEAGENIEEAKKISAAATAYAKAEMLKPTEKKPETVTAKQWNDQRKRQYGMYADTYAFILYKTGDYKIGFQYAKEAAGINENKNAEYNERYSLLLEKVMPAATAKKQIEQFVKDGAASSKTKEVLKRLYTAEKKTTVGYDDYVAQLELAAIYKHKEEVAKTMINQAAPKFSMQDIEGHTVSLESLKGKVVIVDFWATWCGPCVASMPAMKIAQEKLKGRNDVLFLFVNTWQSEENKKQLVADFLQKNNYPFNVLFDNDNKVVTDFKVRGIPTKFVIDKTGNIRFKSVGFLGNNDTLIDEVETMVNMASSDMLPLKK